MAYAVTHVIVAIVLIDLYRDYVAKKKFPMWFVLLGGIAGLLPDIDFPLQQIAGEFIGEAVTLHRIWTHSLVCVISFLAIALFFHLQKHKKIQIGKRKVSYEHIALFFMVIAFGWITHLALDCSFAGDYNLTWFPGYSFGFCPHPFSNDTLLGLDAIILLLWLIHEEWAKKIKDFI